ncbi:ROK family protein [Aliterella atlantica]|uniref:ROK family transcriptional regulator n=1 Tax=Aliterella atlantica CENA595 TaxID=1618023 RepID=A0A0D8ZSP7_9CYAN|nr:ROK family protein [Aliterella atlantica]KJH71387.1 ROK family transcriptional regulator [Aliterella atlantica CENA595]
MTSSILALDFGGTKLAAAVITIGEHQLRSHRRVLSPPNASATTDLEIVRTLKRELQLEQIAAIGVSFGGPVDAITGTVHLSHHVPGWENVPLADILAAEFNVPVSVDNDANVAAMGEHRFGAGKGFSNLLYITVSTGVGGGWILGDRPWRGTEGMAGEIGHIVVDPTGPLCLCGKRGCLERLASGRYIAQQVQEQLQQQPERGKILRTLGANIESITAVEVSQAAAKGDDLAEEALQKAAWALGVAIGNAANLINPQRFVLGGGVTKAGESFWAEIQRVARETALPEVHFDIVPAMLGDEAPLWGAIALAEDAIAQI